MKHVLHIVWVYALLMTAALAQSAGKCDHLVNKTVTASGTITKITERPMSEDYYFRDRRTGCPMRHAASMMDGFECNVGETITVTARLVYDKDEGVYEVVPNLSTRCRRR